MIICRKLLKRTLVALAVITLSACGNIQTVKSFSTKYQQPTLGELAKIRVVSKDGMVRAVPNSDCVDWRLPGAGVMVSSKKGFAQVNDQKLEMPAGNFSAINSTTDANAISELYIPAGKPLVLYYLSQGNARYQCFVQKSFIPASGENYEAVFTQENSMCRFGIYRLKPEGGIDNTKNIKLSDSQFCRQSDNF